MSCWLYLWYFGCGCSLSWKHFTLWNHNCHIWTVISTYFCYVIFTESVPNQQADAGTHVLTWLEPAMFLMSSGPRLFFHNCLTVTGTFCLIVSKANCHTCLVYILLLNCSASQWWLVCG